MCHHWFLEISFILTYMFQGQYLKSSCLVAEASSNLNMLKGTTNISVVLKQAEKLPEDKCGMQSGWLPWDCPCGVWMWESVFGENWSSQCGPELVPDSLAWDDAGTGGNVDATRKAEVFELLSYSCPAVSGYSYCVYLGALIFKLLI